MFAWRWSSCVVVLAAVGCTTGAGLEDVGRSSLAGAICRRARDCSCPEVELAVDTDGSCEEAVLDRFWWWSYDEATAYLGLDATPVFDTRCLARAIAFVQQAECDDDLGDFFDAPPCAFYRGTGNLGDTCRDVPPGLSGCLDGLVCTEGRCEHPHVAATASGRPAAGEPCDEEGECDEEAWCDFTVDDGPICRARAELGDPCTGHEQCRTIYCPAGRCAERPGEGEPCGANDLCADGLECDGEHCIGAGRCFP